MINKKSNGYTLIELLAVIIIIVVVGSIIVGILTYSLRGGNRSSNVEDLRQNGNYALSQMTKMIAYAKTFEGVSTGALDGNGNMIYDTNCIPTNPPAPTPTPTPTQYSYIKILSFDGGETVFSCDSGLTPTISSNSASMLDTTLVTVSFCSFTCTQTNLTFPPTININFTLSKKNSGSFSESNFSIPFNTSVTLRNN